MLNCLNFYVYTLLCYTGIDRNESPNRKNKTEIKPFTEILVSVPTGTEVRFGFIPC